MQRIKKGDIVQVIAGNDKGVQGEVLEVKKGWQVSRKRQRVRRDPNRDRVVVSGVRLVKKHQRPVSQTRTQTGIIEFEAPIHISNVMLVCPNCKEATRIRFEVEPDGKKYRVCKRCGAPIDK
ncbi:MAG: 50S ribosomal protein L24 [Caldilineae bacterium]|nr:MAG: 50S ribosomal protein L24 [Caldilineae bacterium]